MAKVTKPGRGRPSIGSEPLLEPVVVRLTPEMKDAVEAIRKSRLDGAKTSQVVRELIAEALAQRLAKKKGQ